MAQKEHCKNTSWKALSREPTSGKSEDCGLYFNAKYPGKEQLKWQKCVNDEKREVGALPSLWGGVGGYEVSKHYLQERLRSMK